MLTTLSGGWHIPASAYFEPARYGPVFLSANTAFKQNIVFLYSYLIVFYLNSINLNFFNLAFKPLLAQRRLILYSNNKSGISLRMQEQLDSWIQQAKNGDQQAFFKLYQQFKGKVYAICLRLLADRAQAEDGCQEVFVRIWQQLPGFRGDSSFSTWLHTIASRTAVDLWRKNKILRLSTDEEVPEQHAELLPQNSELEDAILRLPHQARAVFVLFALEGYQHQEIAQMLDIAEGSSKAQYHRARQLLRGWLDEN